MSPLTLQSLTPSFKQEEALSRRAPSRLRSLQSTASPEQIDRRRFPARRQSELLALLNEFGQLRVSDLAGRLSVSTDTVRRDLNWLGRKGLLVRTFGGAVSSPYSVHGSSLSPRPKEDPASVLAQAAARLIRDGETLAINGGRTGQMLVERLTQRHLKIVTNNLLISSADTPHEVYLLGGKVLRDPKITLSSMLLGDSSLRVDSAIIFADAISEQAGLMAASPEEASIARAMIEAADRTIALVEHAKLRANALAQIASIDQLDVLVTDQSPASNFTEALRRSGTNLIVADHVPAPGEVARGECQKMRFSAASPATIH
jgi:DeoR family transcriptional regulator, fructose operon transcriptional repressor